MDILDYRERSLASRVHAAEDLRSVETLLAAGGDFLVDLGTNLAMTSWIDGFLVPIARRVGSSPGLMIVCDSELTRSHMNRVFASRGVRARIARTRDDAAGGSFNLIPAA